MPITRRGRTRLSPADARRVAAELLRSLPSCVPAPIRGSRELAEALAGWYEGPGRSYHVLMHLREMIALWRYMDGTPVVAGLDHPAEYALALLLHHAVYDVGRDDNAERSAIVARAWARRILPGADADLVARLIERTAHHGEPLDGLSAEEALLLDMDFAVLGTDPTSYDAYATSIRAEYALVMSDAEYLAARIAWLERMLAAKSLYHTRRLQTYSDATARENMARELAACRTELARVGEPAAAAAELDDDGVDPELMDELATSAAAA